MIVVENKKENKVSERQPLRDQTNLFFKNILGKHIKSLSNNKNSTHRDCTETILNISREKKKQTCKENGDILSLKPLLRVKPISEVVNMKDLKVVLNREQLTPQFNSQLTKKGVTQSSKNVNNLTKKNAKEQRFQGSMHSTEQVSSDIKTRRKATLDEKQLGNISMNSLQLTRSLKVVLEKSPECCSPKLLGFSQKDIKEAPSTPKTKKLVKENTPTSLKVCLERFDFLNSPEFLGFPKNHMENASTFTPKTLKVLLSRVQSSVFSDSRNESSGDEVEFNLDSFRESRNSGFKHISEDCNNSIKKSLVYLPKKSKNKVLQIIINKNSTLETSLVTQIDGVCHLSETDLDNNFISSPERLVETGGSKFILDTSPHFKGFEKQGSISPVLKRLFESSSDEMHEYLTMLAEECDREKGNENIWKQKDNQTTTHGHNQVIKTNKSQNQEQEVCRNKSAAHSHIQVKSIKSRNQEKQNQVCKNKSVAKNNPKPIVSKINQAHVSTRNKQQEALLELEPHFYGFEEKEQSSPIQKVTFKCPNRHYLEIIEESILLNQPNLRKLPGQNYFEESSVDTSETETPKMLVLPKKVPIYKQQVPEDNFIKPQHDEYEFSDISPKKRDQRKFKKRLQRSSGFFDKETHLVVKKLEKKDQIKRRKQVKKNINKRTRKTNKKCESYEKIVGNILSNVLQKVGQKNQVPVAKNLTEKSDNKIRPPAQSSKITVHAVVHTNQPSSIRSITEKPQNRIVYPDQNNQINVKALIHTEIPAKVVPNIKIISTKVPEHGHDLITTENSQQTNDIVVVSNNQNVPENKQEKIQNIIEDNVNVEVNVTMPETQIPTIKEIQTNLSETNVQQNMGDVSAIQNDIETSFGFDENRPQTSSPINLNINVISNLAVNRGVCRPVIDSPINFDVRRPNANSTMLGRNSKLDSINRSSGSPWRLDLKHVRQNPHFISVKSNALPRIDQEMVLEHTLVEEFESHCTKTPRIEETKKSPVQQSILNYMDCDNDVLEKENMLNPRSSLFDYEAFNSPVKTVTRRNDKVQTARRKVLGDSGENNIINSTPVPEEPQNNTDENNITYFGFDENTPEKENKQKSKVTKTTDLEKAKPSRFNPHILKKYMSKKKLKEQKQAQFFPVENVPSVSLLNVTNVADKQINGAEICLFGDPEELFDSKPVEVRVKRTKRPRTDSIDDPDDNDRKQKKHKKTILEIEREKWIKSFNKELEEVDNFDLPTE